MKFCEKCNYLCKDEICPVCGASKLREVEPNDFCYFTECTQSLGQVFKSALDNNGIDCALIPVGNGVRSLFGLRLENFRIYIPFCHLKTAEEIYAVITGQVEG